MPITVATLSNLGKWHKAAMQTVASCLSAQAFLGVASAVDAAAKIHLHTLPAFLDETADEAEWRAVHPFIAIMPPASGDLVTLDKIATGSVFTESSSLEMMFRRIVPMSSGMSDQDLQLQFMDQVMLIVEELASKVDGTGQWWFDRVTVSEEIWRASIRDQAMSLDTQTWTVEFGSGENP